MRDRRGQNIAVFVTARVYKGLPFVPWRSMKLILEGILARAQDLYPVLINDFLFMGNHLHFILSGPPCHISPFMNYIDGEIANTMTILCGPQYEGLFWEDRFKEQRLCTWADVVKKKAYLYLNPERAGLVSDFRSYTGLSSWQMFSSGTTEKTCPRVPRRVLKAFPDRCTVRSDLELMKKLKKQADHSFNLRLTPYAAKKCFAESRSRSNENLRAEIFSRIEDDRKTIERTGGALGPERLFSQRLRKEYTPGHHSWTPYLICYDNELRIEKILDYRAFCRACRASWQARVAGMLNVIFPRGAYQPGCSLVPVAMP